MSIRQPQTLRRASLLVGIAAFTVIGAACGSSDSQGAGSSASDSTSTASTVAKPASKPNQVTIKLIAYRPATLTAPVGDTVTWTQTDPGFHTVTSGTVEQGSSGVTTQPDGKFASGQLATGKTFSHAFTEPGTYTYFCEIHPATMHGTITVP